MSATRGSAATRSRPPPPSEDREKAYRLADLLRGASVVRVEARVSDTLTRVEHVDAEVLRRWLDAVVGERVAR